MCVQGGMQEETRQKLGLMNLTDPPVKPYTVPVPKKGTLYDYRFIKEVRTQHSHIHTSYLY